MKSRRVCSWLLLFVLIMSMFSVTTFADETEITADEQIIEEEIAENISPEKQIEEDTEPETEVEIECDKTDSGEEDRSLEDPAQEYNIETISIGYGQNYPSVSWSRLCELGRNSTTDEFFFNQLSDFEKGFYEFDKALETSTDQYVDEFFLTDVPMDITDLNSVCDRAHAALLSDDPTFVMKRRRMAGGNKIYNSADSYTMTFVKDGFYSEYRYEKALNRVDDIVSAIDPSDDRYTKIKKLGSYRNSYFSYDAFVKEFYSPASSSAFGLLIKNRAVCTGFSDTFKILCNRVGVPCIIVGNAGHAWNYVQMEDGKWYSIDWQDTGDYLLGKNSPMYLNEGNYHISELYIEAPGDFVFPELADDEYVYTGGNEDFSINVIDTEYDVADKGFQYVLNQDKVSYTITGYKGIIPEHFEIPEKINGLPVTVIGTHAFDNETKISGRVVLPQSIIEIQECAFEGCSGITEIVFNDGLKTIGDAAFFGCTGISGSMILPDELETFGKYVFYNCNNLNGSFYIPKTLTSMDGKSVKNSGIKEFIVDSENDKYSAFDGVLYSRDGKTLLVCPDGKTGELRIKDGTQIIADSACMGCTGITSVSFADSLISIEDYAFMNCRFKGDLEIPNGVEAIGHYAFWREPQYSCDGVLSLPVSLKTIGMMAFYGCGFTGDVFLSPNIEKIGTVDDDYMVFGENNIDSYTVYCGNNAALDYITRGLLMREGDTQKLNVIHSICPDSDVYIGDNCPVCGNVIDSIPEESVSHLLARVPYQESTCLNTGIKEHWFCSKCQKRFADKDGTTEISMDDMVIDAVGHNWKEMSRTDLSSYYGVQSIMLKCEKCREIDEEFLVNNTYYSVYDGVLYSRNGTTLLACPKNKIGVLSIHEGTEVIADDACKNCEKITGVIFPKSLKTINDSAFQYTRFSGDLVLPDSVEYIGFEAFDRDPYYSFGGKLVLPASIKEIKGWAFTGCGFIGQLYIPSTIEKIGYDKHDNPVTNMDIFGGVNDFTAFIVACDNTLVIDYLTNTGDWDYSSQIQCRHLLCTETDYTEEMICSSCNSPIDSLDNIMVIGHDYKEIEGTAVSATCISDGRTADKECSRCHDKKTGERIPASEHQLIIVRSKEPTCTETGNIEYWKCYRCKKLFSDKNGEHEIAQADTVILAKGHKAAKAVMENEVEATCMKEGSYYSVVYCTDCGEEMSRCIKTTDKVAHKPVLVKAKAATLTAKGNTKHYKCSVCKKLFTDKECTIATTSKKVTIARLINIKSAKITGISSKTYTGKALTQSPAVKLNGVTLKKNTDYTLTYKKNIDAGTAEVTISGKGKYGGSVNETFTIKKAVNPLKIRVSSKSYKSKDLSRKRIFTIGVSKAQGNVAYTRAANTKNAGITVTSAGKVTVPKNCKEGIYKISVKAAGNGNYKSKTLTVTIKVSK